MQPPSDYDAEANLLGLLLTHPQLVHRAVAVCQPAHFYDQRNRETFKAIMSASEKRLTPDLPLVTTYIKDAGLSHIVTASYLTDLYMAATMPSNFDEYLDRVQKKYRARRVMNTCQWMADNFDEDVNATLNEAIAKLKAIANDGLQFGSAPIADVLPHVLNDLENQYSALETQQGTLTGYGSFDAMTGGLQPGQVMILAARPGMGKTTFAQNIALNIALRGGVVVLFSLEMDKKQLTKRFISMVTGVSGERMKNPKTLCAQEWMKIQAAQEAFDALNIEIIDNTRLNPLQLTAQIHQIKERYGRLDLVLIDYIGLITPIRRHTSINKEQEISEISREIKLMSMELEVPTIALSQLNRAVESRQDKRPMLSDLRDSGSIEQDADIVAFLYRDEYYNKNSTARGEVELIVAKQRDGATGTCRLLFKGHEYKFIDRGESVRR